jgi:hypothetical protein
MARRQVWRHFQNARSCSGWGRVGVWVCWWRTWIDVICWDAVREGPIHRAVLKKVLGRRDNDLVQSPEVQDTYTACVYGWRIWRVGPRR